MSHTGGRSTGWQRAAALNRWRLVNTGAADGMGAAAVFICFAGKLLTHHTGFEQAKVWNFPAQLCSGHGF
jgi:hypothetical protein